MDWTPDKKIGDHVAFPLPFGTPKYRRFIIAAETPTMWVGQCGVRVRKKDGRIIGSDYRSVYDMTPKLLAMIVERETQLELEKLIANISHADVTTKREAIRLIKHLFPEEEPANHG